MTLVHYDLIISSTEKRAKAMGDLAEAAELGFGTPANQRLRFDAHSCSAMAVLVGPSG